MCQKDKCQSQNFVILETKICLASNSVFRMVPRGRSSEDEQCSVNFAICKTEKQDHDPVFSGQEDDRTV